MNSLFKKTLIVGTLLVAAFQLQASLISLGDHPQGGDSNPNTETGLIEGISGEDLTFLYRYPTGEGDLDAFFTATDNLDGSADVSWDLTGSGFEVWALGVKSGNDFIHWYGVTADQRLTTTPQGVTAPAGINSVGHISFFGKITPDVDPIPDGGSTALLLGIALLGVQACRRMSVSK